LTEDADGMTRASAEAAVDRMESDEAFAARIKGAGGREPSLGVLRANGFDVTADDMRDVFLDRFGDQLTTEQLDAVSGGLDDAGAQALGIALGVGAGAVTAGLCVAAVGAAIV
jgi:hypothetical protein